jgi:hypothetical protein
MPLFSNRFDGPHRGLNKWRPEGGERAFLERERRYASNGSRCPSRAAGNVGAYAVQLARRAGVRTIATAGTEPHPKGKIVLTVGASWSYVQILYVF